MNAAKSKTLAKIQVNYTDETVTAWSREIGLTGPDGLEYTLCLNYTEWDGFDIDWYTDEPAWAEDLDPSDLDILTA